MSSEPAWHAFHELPRAHGAPPARGRVRASATDFEVDEELGFAPDGDGEHWLLRVRKVGVNTEWVARQLAALAGVAAGSVGYAGLKDRHAVASQWFSVPAARSTEPDWGGVGEAAFHVLEAHRHRRKLRRGTLAGNAFRLRVRDTSADPAQLAERLQQVSEHGVPSYFGEQRFGIASGNLAQATAYFEGRSGRIDRHRRGLYLSAVRSQLFNELLALRVLRGDWDRPLAGDRMILAGSRSHFLLETVDAEVEARVRRGDLHPSGPLWGRGAPPTTGEPARLERQVTAAYPVWTQGLERAGLRQERRALRLLPQDLDWSRQSGGILELSFRLPAGGYATSVLRELVAQPMP